jgi:hypothetical protein
VVHLANTLLVAGVALMMLLAGFEKHALVRRRTGRCPSCGRSIRNCACR